MKTILWLIGDIDITFKLNWFEYFIFKNIYKKKKYKAKKYKGDINVDDYDCAFIDEWVRI